MALYKWPNYITCSIKVNLKFLSLWGAHQGVDQVGMFSHLDEVEMTRKYRKEHDLMNFEAEDLIGMGGLKKVIWNTSSIQKIEKLRLSE